MALKAAIRAEGVAFWPEMAAKSNFYRRTK